jgi:hypothetical protein
MAVEAYFPAELAARIPAGWLTVVLGAALAGAFAATALGQALAGRVRGVRRGQIATACGYGAAAIGLCLLAVPAPAWAAWVAAPAAVWLAYFGLGFAAPALGAAFHERVRAEDRAAMLALRSLVTYGGGVAATVVLGVAAARHDVAVVWLVAAGLAAVATVGLAAWRPADGRTITMPAAVSPAAPPAQTRS